MIDIKDFNFFENQKNFDFKAFFIKIGSYWKWFVFCLALSFTVAYQVNIRKQKIYSLENSISIKEEDNPLFTSNTSLIFNWGGTSDQVQTVATTLKSRSHNEQVVDRLDFYVDYFIETPYFLKDVYGETPFSVDIDKTKNQLLSIPIEIKFLNPTTYQITINFESNTVDVINYSTNTVSHQDVASGVYTKTLKIGEKLSLPFLNFSLKRELNKPFASNQKYSIAFNSFDAMVSDYQKIKVDVDEKAASVLRLSLDGYNKARIVAYLNETVRVLIKNQLLSKNLFAENTIKFIDTTLIAMENDLKSANKDLTDFSRKNNVIELEKGGSSLQDEVTRLDIEKDAILRKIDYYNTLTNYLIKSNDYSKLPAPTVAGIEDPNINLGVSKIISLSVQRSEMDFSVKSSILYNNIDNDISSVKKVLLENINSAKGALSIGYNQVTANLNKIESLIKELPIKNQDYLKIIRNHDLLDGIYQTYLQKRSEASIVKAANLSDIKFIDTAKDTGGGLIGPRTSINYILALFLGLFAPLFVILFLMYINNSIQNTDDLSLLTTIPLLGVVGVKLSKNNLSVFERPKSSLSESFRAIRSSLQFLYRNQKVSGAKTLMLTSSISGEGKTFCSINIATVFAMSEKKTVIVGLDLRKPKIYSDFGLTNEIGVVNYLIGQKTIDEIILKSHVPYLDVITSGPIPPNPSELIMGETMNEMLEELKQRYDYVILDTPPVGLVTDAVELSSFVDVTLYVTRQNYTKKEMISLLNTRVKRGELQNVSIILNGFENKAKYGAGYGYSYGAYSYGYHEEEETQNWFKKIVKTIQKKISTTDEK